MIKLKINKMIEEITLEKLICKTKEESIPIEAQIQSELIFGDSFWHKLTETKIYEKIAGRVVHRSIIECRR